MPIVQKSKRPVVVESNKKTPPKISAHPKGAMKQAIRINHCFDSGQRGVFANNFAIQNEQGVFHLLFFQIDPPFVLGDDHEKAEKLKRIDYVDAHCVARIVVPQELAMNIRSMIAENQRMLQSAVADVAPAE